MVTRTRRKRGRRGKEGREERRKGKEGWKMQEKRERGREGGKMGGKEREQECHGYELWKQKNLLIEACVVLKTPAINSFWSSVTSYVQP